MSCLHSITIQCRPKCFPFLVPVRSSHTTFRICQLSIRSHKRTDPLLLSIQVRDLLCCRSQPCSHTSQCYESLWNSSLLTRRMVVHIHAFPVLLRRRKYLVHYSHLMQVILVLAPPQHRIAVHGPMRIPVQRLIAFKVQETHKFVARRACPGIDPI
jgi:hypothetical protein